jgi:hypothetical protein
MKAPRRLEGLEQRSGRFRNGLSQPNQSIKTVLPPKKKKNAHLDGFVWHTRHAARVSLRERKKSNCQLGLHLLCVGRGGRGRGRT